jgi:hypothetical protein
MADPWAGFTDQATQPPPQAPQADPWAGFSDAGPNAASAAAEDKGTFLHPKRPASTGWQYTKERLAQYPGLVAGAVLDALKAGPELMRDVATGQTDPLSEEGIRRGFDTAAVISPTSAASRTGLQIARRAAMKDLDEGAAARGLTPAAPIRSPDYRARPASFEAAQTASDLGAPLPAGIVSQTPGIQAATQAARQLPFVGQQIDERVGQTIKAAGERVGNIAEDLAGEVRRTDGRAYHQCSKG